MHKLQVTPAAPRPCNRLLIYGGCLTSTAFDDVERAAFVSEELELTPYEMAPLSSINMPVDGEGDESEDDC